MTTPHYRAIVTARRRCAVNDHPHIGAPLGIRPAHQRGWRRWRWWG